MIAGFRIHTFVATIVQTTTLDLICASMQTFLAILFRCVLALSLGFIPVANAFDMADMTTSQDDAPPCHAPDTDQHKPDGKCCGGVNHCHCAMANVLPTAMPVVAYPVMPSDHPQTARQLALQQPVIPDTPPPRT